MASSACFCSANASHCLGTYLLMATHCVRVTQGVGMASCYVLLRLGSQPCSDTGVCTSACISHKLCSSHAHLLDMGLEVQDLWPARCLWVCDLLVSHSGRGQVTCTRPLVLQLSSHAQTWPMCVPLGQNGGCNSYHGCSTASRAACCVCHKAQLACCRRTCRVATPQ